MPNITKLSPKQVLFKEMLVGILLYSVVLGFFNDYTDILKTSSYSVTFAVAIVMQVLTYLTFGLKDIVKHYFKQKDGPNSKYLMAFCIWLILFLSKFVFLEVIDIIFGNNVEISGFVGLMLIIICMTVFQKLFDYIFLKLGEQVK